MYDSVKSVKDNFIRADFPYFLITDSKGEVLCKNESEGNIDTAADLLENFFNAIRRGSTMIFVVKHYKKIPNGGLKKNCDPDCTSSFKNANQYSDEERSEYRALNPRNNDLLMEIREMREEMRLMKIKLDLEEAGDDGDVEESTQSNYLGAFLGNPKVQDAFANLLTNITANLITPPIQQQMNNQTMRPPQTLSGTNDQQEMISLEQIIEILFSKGVTIEDLYKLSQMSPSKIKSLKTFL